MHLPMLFIICVVCRDTPLHVASVLNDVELAKLLIEKKAELDLVGQNG